MIAITPDVIDSLTVLPFDNFMGDPKQEYFIDGMTDALTTDMGPGVGRVPDMSGAAPFKKIQDAVCPRPSESRTESSTKRAYLTKIIWPDYEMVVFRYATN